MPTFVRVSIGRSVCLSAGFIRISTFIEDIPDVKIPANHNSKKETGMVGLKNQVNVRRHNI